MRNGFHNRSSNFRIFKVDSIMKGEINLFMARRARLIKFAGVYGNKTHEHLYRSMFELVNNLERKLKMESKTESKILTARQQFHEWIESITIQSELDFLLAYQYTINLGLKIDCQGMTARQVELAKLYDYFYDFKRNEK